MSWGLDMLCRLLWTFHIFFFHSVFWIMSIHIISYDGITVQPHYFPLFPFEHSYIYIDIDIYRN